MANLFSIARPYALAAFEVAYDAKELPQWTSFLEAATLVAQNKTVTPVLNNPEISSQKTFDLFVDILSSLTDEKRRNFLLLLSQNDRLPLLPEIYALFKAYVAESVKISDVRIVTAIEIDDAYKQKLKEALTKRINRDVTLHCEIDPDILGGAVIHIGDHVIDGSIRGKLTRLLEFSLR